MNFFTTGYNLKGAKFLFKLICAMCFHPWRIEIANLRIFIFCMPFYSQSDYNKKKKNNKNKLIVTLIIFMLQSTNSFVLEICFL